jgi:aspartokinase-like uncharacterized kinase
MSATPLRVIKLGGSLLDFEGLVPQLRRWLSEQAPAINLVVVGGGRLVDAIRQIDRAQRLTEQAAHWLSIKAMGLTADSVAGLLPEEATLIADIDELVRTGLPARLYILDVGQFLRQESQRSHDPLPASWQVTSDSIAARLARTLSASELVLLKSALPDRCGKLADLIAVGYVDRYFQRAGGGAVPIRCVNLRAGGFPAVDLDQPETAGRLDSKSGRQN